MYISGYIIGYIVGYTIGLIILFKIKLILDYRFYNRKQRWLKSLSPDRDYERFRSGYILYANNSRWYIENFITWKLIWLPYSSGNDIGKILDSNFVHLEFQATRLPECKMYKLVKRIIFTHPNL